MRTKAGFTLVEITVVLAIFGVLVVVGTNFFLSVLRSSNQATLQNEVRQEAQKIMLDIVSEIRKGSNYTTMYSVDTDGNLSKNGIRVNSNSVAVIKCSYCNTCSIPGLKFEAQPNGEVKITLDVQQSSVYSNANFCARTTLTDSVAPRVY